MACFKYMTVAKQLAVSFVQRSVFGFASTAALYAVCSRKRFGFREFPGFP